MSESFWSPKGKRLGSVRQSGSGKSNVYNGWGQPVGTVGRNGTYDVAGRRIADKPLPGLLMNRPNKQPKR